MWVKRKKDIQLHQQRLLVLEKEKALAVAEKTEQELRRQVGK